MAESFTTRRLKIQGLRDEVEELAIGIAAWHRELSTASDTQVVFRDSAFADDVAKTNMTAILEQNDIDHVRSL
jgi:adenine-specific DNA-methyltransferase